MWWQLFLNGVWEASELVLMAAAVSIYLSLTRAYNFTLAICFAVAGYAAYGLGVSGISAAVAIAIAVAAAAGVAASLELLVFGPLRRHRRSTLAELVVSLGLYLVAANVLAVAFGNGVRLPVVGPRATLNILGGKLTLVQASCIGAAALGVAALLLWTYRTRQGLLVRATSDRPELAKALGLPIHLLSLIAAGVVGLAAGLAGAIQCWDTGITPTAGMRPFLLAAVAAIIGGGADVRKAAVAGGVFGLVSALAVGVLPGTWSESLGFGVLVIVLLCRAFGPVPKLRSG